MPFKSEAQRRFFNANRAKLEKQGVNVDEWNNSSKGQHVPEHVGDRKNFHKFVKDKVRSKR
jgi:hypothetical protein